MIDARIRFSGSYAYIPNTFLTVLIDCICYRINIQNHGLIIKAKECLIEVVYFHRLLNCRHQTIAINNIHSDATEHYPVVVQFSERINRNLCGKF